MIDPKDFDARGWRVLPSFAGAAALSTALLDEMTAHPEAPGESSWGTRNVLHAFILSLKPKSVLEIGSHIGFGSVVIGTALKANGFGRSYHLEPQDHYFVLLQEHLRKAGLEEVSTPLKLFSTAPEIQTMFGEKFDIIFLDANHSYSAAYTDLGISDSLIAPNGLIFLDDVGPGQSASLDPEGRGGVRQALLDFSASRPDYKVIFFEPPFWLNPCGLALACKQDLLEVR